ncbi:hypothetical protein QOZ80_8BG0663620 [Eleusine coracana subsp. coracana]|nr:hypothetical protein QOZ80_8BG0663620 [Eleusine coracana subsp. coracana]
MDSTPRKRKGAPPACSAARSLQDLASRKRFCRESDPHSPRPDGGPRGAPPAAVMTAPAASGASASAVPGRGHKRKVGCIDSATRLGRRKRLDSEYELGDEIGHGKFGRVRACRARVPGGEDEELACKALPKGGGDTAHREMEVMQHLSGHPGVVTLKAVFEDADSFYLVMELCSGGRLLDEVARDGRLSERRAANVVRELMAVLKYCHEMGLRILDWPCGFLMVRNLMVSLGVLHTWLLRFYLVATHRSVQWASVSLLARDLMSQMLNRDSSSRFSADEVLRHPWVLFYTECPLKAEFSHLWSTNKAATPMVQLDRVSLDCESSASESSSGNSEEQDECVVVDALTAAITQHTIVTRNLCGDWGHGAQGATRLMLDDCPECMNR